MSYLNNYRINFWGGISTNVCTANNDDVGYFYADPIQAKLSPTLLPMTDDAAIETLQAKPGWNYFGDYTTKFQDAKISSFGEPDAIESKGAIIGQGIYLLGSLDPSNANPTPIGSPIMVDIDSTGTSCTQILVGGLQIGGTDNPLLRITENTRCYTRSLQTVDATSNEGSFQVKSITGYQFGKANTSWQLSFAYDDSWEFDETNPQIATLVAKAKAAKGITVVFTQFEVMLMYSRAAIIQEYENGNGTINPVLGYTIGSIGIWEEGEAATCLPGRLLEATLTGDSPICQADTYAQLDETTGILSLNMASTFVKPLARTDRNDLSTMSPTADPVNLHLAVRKKSSVVVLARIPYNATNYYLSGGIVDIQLNETEIATIKQGDLQLVAVDDSLNITATYAQEQTYRIISDDRGVYVNPNETKNLSFAITKWGQPVTEDLDLTITFSDSGVIAASFGLYTEMNVGFSTKAGAIPFKVLDATAHTYIGTTKIKAADAASFQLSTNWIQAGFKQVNLYVNGAQTANYYMVIRTYPDDDYSAIPAAQKYTWDFVYNEVLRYYYVIFPAMSTRLPLNNEVLISQQVFGVIQKRISEPYANTTLLMPITRDMSPGKVQLLNDYLTYVNQ